MDNWSIENCFPPPPPRHLQLIGLCFEHQLSKSHTNRWDMNCTSQDATLHWPFHGSLGLSPSATAPKTRMEWKDVLTIESKRAENVNDEFTAKKEKSGLFHKMTESSLRGTDVTDRSQRVKCVFFFFFLIYFHISIFQIVADTIETMGSQLLDLYLFQQFAAKWPFRSVAALVAELVMTTNGKIYCFFCCIFDSASETSAGSISNEQNFNHCNPLTFDPTRTPLQLYCSNTVWFPLVESGVF